MYTARVRIIDAKTGVVVGQQTCQIKDGDADAAPTYDELTDNNGAILKEQIGKAADACVMQIADKILGYRTSISDLYFSTILFRPYLE